MALFATALLMAGRVALFDDHVVAVEHACFDHGVAAHLEHLAGARQSAE
jgi:hypothetical protein